MGKSVLRHRKTLFFKWWALFFRILRRLNSEGVLVDMRFSFSFRADLGTPLDSHYFIRVNSSPSGKNNLLFFVLGGGVEGVAASGRYFFGFFFFSHGLGDFFLGERASV